MYVSSSFLDRVPFFFEKEGLTRDRLFLFELLAVLIFSSVLCHCLG